MTARRAAAVVAALTALGALLRVPGLDAGLWFDEIVTLVESIRPPLADVVTAFPGYNNHPFYSLLANLSVAGLGEHAWTVRLPAFIFGVAGIPLLYRLGAAVANRSEGLMAALLLTVSYHHVWFSQNARGYTVLLFFTLLATLLFVRLLQEPRPQTAMAYGIVVGLGVYTHLTMAFVVMAHVIIWAWQLRREPTIVQRSRHLRMALLALGVASVSAGLLYLPMAQQVYAVLSGPRPATASVATPKWAVLETLRGLRIGFGTVGLLGALALVALGGLSYLRKNPLAAFLFLLPGAISAGVMLVAGMSIRPRFFFSLLGFGLLMLVRGAMEAGILLQSWTRLDDRRFRTGEVIVVLIAAISALSLRFNYQYPKQDYGGAREFIERHRGAAETVVTAGLATYPYARYYQMPWSSLEKPDQFGLLRARTDRVWVVYSFEEYMDAGLVEQIREGCTPQRTFPGTLGGGDIIVCTLEK